MIKNRYEELKARGKPTKFIKYKESKNHLTREVQRKSKIYEYYICDNCGAEIIIKNKWEHSVGGVVMLSELLTHKKAIIIAVCNKCLNSVLKEFEERGD